MYNFKRISCRFAAIALSLVAGCVYADDETENQWEFNGFGTLSWTNTDKYDIRIPRRNINQSGADIHDNGFLLDSRLGLQAEWHINEHWDFTAQAVAREQLAQQLIDYVDIFYFSYQANNQWRVGIGRQAFDLFFMSDYHNTGYSYEWVRPPTEFYGTVPYQSFDGIKVTHSWGDFENSWRWRVSVGNVKSKFDAGVAINAEEIDSTKAEPIYSTELTWETGKWQLRSSYAHLKFTHELGDEHERQELQQATNEISQYWPEFNHIIDDFTRSFILRYSSVGASWNHNDWKVQAEWSNVSSDVVTFDGQRSYILVSKRFDKWQPFVTLGYARDKQKIQYQKPADDLGLNEFYGEVTHFVQNMRHNQKSLSLGLRWDFAAKKALKFQCDRFFFEAGSGSIHGRVDFRYPQDEVRTWCTASYDWVF